MNNADYKNFTKILNKSINKYRISFTIQRPLWSKVNIREKKRKTDTIESKIIINKIATPTAHTHAQTLCVLKFQRCC